MFKNKQMNIKTIGYTLAVLYALSLWAFVIFIQIPDYTSRIVVYFLLFVALFVGSIAVIRMQEWGRKLLVAINAAMFIVLFIKFIPKVNIVPLSYFILNAVVFLYFNQARVRIQFAGKKTNEWKSILVVDDDISIIKIIRPILMSNGYSVLTAQTGEEGIQIAKLQKPDLVLLDVILPGIKGREVCKQLKSDPLMKDIPVVFLTSKDSPDDIQAEMSLGASGHLTKPVNAKILISTIQKILS
ncbi:MAG: response regulator [Candidatus Omnitrophica bacterium]|nr:response regulator [Candidatus Omnitrophota bacterium]